MWYAVTYPGPRCSAVDLLMATWLSVKMYIWRWYKQCRHIYFRHVRRHSWIACSLASNRSGYPTMKCRQNIANPTSHAPKPLGTHSKLLWTLRKMETTFPLMEEMEKLMELMKEARSICHSASRVQKQQQQHHHNKHQPETLRSVSSIVN
jgi:hypothetical protein